MLAEMFETDLRQCSQTGKTDLPPALNLLELYDQFMERKLNISYQEKLKTDMTNVLQDICELIYKILMEKYVV
jgi:hypothetical protein